MKKDGKLHQLLSLVVCVLILLSLTVVKQGKLMGHEIGLSRDSAMAGGNASAVANTVSDDTLRVLPDGSVVVNTSSLAADISGYGGRVPLEITVKNGVVTNVKALENSESEPFFNRASELFNVWKGKTVGEALALNVDAVSGATFSSKAIMGNMQRGLQYLQRSQTHINDGDNAGSAVGELLSAKGMCGLVVVLMAAILPLFVKNRRYRLVQFVLNVAVLGFWCGSFLSYSSVIGFLANGWQGVAFIVPAIMLVVAFVYPLFGKKSYYCTYVCPFGSLQQLAGTCIRHKPAISRRWLSRLDVFRQVLWALLMLFVWSGVWSQWIDCEPFTAFLFRSASLAAIVIAVVFVLLSFVVLRPYCRFVCPVGTLLRFSQH